MTIVGQARVRFLFVVAMLGAGSASALISGGVSAGSLTQAKTGGSGSGGIAGVGSTAAAPDLFTGALVHSLPIEVVPGRHGMQPDVALRYRSTNGNGPLGVGWELEFGDIERQTKNGLDYAADDYTLRSGSAAVDLVNMGGCGTSCTQYSAKFESAFLRIRKLPATDGPVNWEVTDRQGTKYFYGRTYFSRQDDPNSPPDSRTFRWCLQYVLDLDGNYMAYSYNKFNGQIYPTEIDYTGHATDAAATNQIIFSWIPRADAGVDSRALGFQVQTVLILDRVTVSAGGTAVRQYQLQYTASSLTGRSLLSSFTQKGKDGTSSLPVTTIDYTSPSATFAGVPLNSAKYANWDNSGDRIHSADVDGDGYEDLVLGPDGNGNWFVMGGSPLNILVDRSQNQPWASGAMSDWGNCDNGCQSHIWVADVTGDAKGDVILGPDPSTGNWSVMQSTGSGFLAPQVWATWNNGGWFGHSARIRLFDVDGDGRTDVLIGPTNTGNFHLLRSNGSGFDVHENYIQSGLSNWDDDASQTRVNVADVNGDGRPDLVLGPDSSGNWYVLINTGSGFTVGPSISWASGLYATWSQGTSSLRLRLMDVNGDGKADVVLGPDTSGNWHVMLSNGSSFEDQGQWNQTPLFSQWSDDLSAVRIRKMDVNGDGLTDLVFGPDSTGSWWVMISTGHGFISSNSGNPWLTGFAGSPWDQTTSQNRIWLMDVNGDGRQDIVLGPDQSGTWYGVLSQGAYPDLIADLYNGYGGSTQIQFTPSTRYSNTLLPMSLQVVSAVNYSDGNGVWASTGYSYAGGYYYYPERDFRGFNAVTVTDPQWPNGVASKTTTLFHQGNDYAVGANNPAVAIGYMKGKPYSTIIGDTSSPNTNFTETDRTYSNSAGPIYFDPTSDIIKYFCASQSSCGRQTHTSFQYDAYGNTTREDHFGDTSDPTDDFTIIRAFSPNVPAWVVNLPYSESTYSGTGAPNPLAANRLAETDYYYDGTANCATQSGSVMPTLGHLTRTVRWLNGGSNPEAWFAYDAFGNQSCSRDPNGNLTQTAYDTSTNTFSLSVTSANQTSSIKYYGVGGVSWTTAASDPGLYGLVQSTTDANQVSSSFTYDVFGRSATRTDADGFLTTWSYNSLGTVGSQNMRTSTPSANSEVYFDGMGRTIRARSQGSAAGSWIGSLTSYLPVGMPSKTSAPYFESSESPLWTYYQYDPHGRMISSTAPDLTTALVCYDDLSGTTVAIDPSGHRKRELKDLYGRRIRFDEYLGTFSSCATTIGTPYATTTHSYDLVNHVHTILNAVGSPVVNSFDTLGRRVSSSDPDLGNWTYSYDSASNLLYQLDGNNHAITFRYDSLNRVVQKHYCANPSQSTCVGESTGPTDVTFTYDDPAVLYSKGRVTKMIDGSGQSSYVYDSLGRITSTTQTIGTRSFTTGASYYPSRRLYTITYPNGSSPDPDPSPNLVVTNSYDSDGNLYTVSSNDAWHTMATLTNYNDVGEVGTVNYGGIATTSYLYDPNNRRLTNAQVTQYNNSSLLLGLSYQYDSVGNITSIVDSVNAANSQSFSYDELNRLVGAKSNGYQPDISLPPSGLVYTYDPVRVHVLKTTSDGRSFNPDGDGNTVADGLRNMTWDYDRRLASVTMGGAVTTMTYDGTGGRVKKQGPGGAVYYSGRLYDTTGTKYIYAGPLRIAAISSAGSTYMYPDQVGSTRVTTDSAAGSQKTSFYQPYGRVASDTTTTHYKFTGQELDSETGLYNYGARYYDTTIGRFISADTVVQDSDPQALNRYSYGRNNPIKYHDPSGHFAVVDDILVGAAVGAAIGATTAALTHRNVAQGTVIGAVSGVLGGAGQGFVAAAGITSTLGSAAVYAATGAAGGVINAGLYGGNVAQYAAVGAGMGLLGYGLGSKQIPFFGHGALGGTLNRFVNASLRGALFGGALAALTGKEIDQGAEEGAAAWAAAEGFNMLVGHGVGLLSSSKPPRFNSDNNWVYDANSSAFKGGGAITFSNVIIGPRWFLDSDNQAGGIVNGTVYDHEASHANQDTIIAPLYLLAHGASLLLGGLAGAVLDHDFGKGTHKYDVLERGWIDVPAWER